MGDDTSVDRVSVYENEIYGQSEVVEPFQKMVFFRLEDEWYAVDIFCVIEILSSQVPTPLPNTPDHVLGIISLRGIILPIIHLKTLFGIQSEKEEVGGNVIVVKRNDLSAGVQVDAVSQIVAIPISKIEKKLPTLQGVHADWIMGQVEHGGRLVALLDLGQVLEKTKLKGTE